jgi:hypothetical protein
MLNRAIDLKGATGDNKNILALRVCTGDGVAES